MNYSNLTPELSALCRAAMQEEDPTYTFQDKDHFGTLHETLKLEAEEEYQLMLAETVFGL